MPLAEVYRKQVALLIKVVPLVAAEPAFALKGGTAINLFLRDMPRVSVDIDLTYVPIKSRASSLKEIDAAMKRIAAAIEHGVRGAKVNTSAPKGGERHNQADRPRRRRADQNRGHTSSARLCLRTRSQVGFGARRGRIRVCGNVCRQFPRPVRRQNCSCARSPTSARPVRCAGFVCQGRHRRQDA